MCDKNRSCGRRNWDQDQQTERRQHSESEPVWCCMKWTTSHFSHPSSCILFFSIPHPRPSSDNLVSPKKHTHIYSLLQSNGSRPRGIQESKKVWEEKNLKDVLRLMLLLFLAVLESSLFQPASSLFRNPEAKSTSKTHSQVVFHHWVNFR